jgi:hypothetical protein
MMHLTGFRYSECFQKFLHSLQVRKIRSLAAVQTMWYTVWTPNCPKNHPSERRELFRSDLLLCREASNCFSLHPSRHFSSTFERHSVFDQLWDFFPKHRYGKIAATVRTMWIPVRTRSSIRQVSHSKSKRPDASLHGLDTRTSYMKIVCIRSTVRTTIPLFRTRETLIWKLHTSEVWPSGRQDNTVRTRRQIRKEFQWNLGKPIA